MSRDHRRKQRQDHQPVDRATAVNSSTVSRKAAANHANARKSTGPRTPEGKARSRCNAMSHGLYARTLADLGPLLGEDPQAFENLHARLIADYAPEGVQEEKMVERLALLWTRLDRLSLYAQQRMLADLTPHIERGPLPVEGDDEPFVVTPGMAIMSCEGFAVFEARLERSISRLQRDLAFLARYRRRNEEGEVEPERAAHEADAGSAEGTAAKETYQDVKPQDAPKTRREANESNEETPTPSVDWTEIAGTNPTASMPVPDVAFLQEGRRLCPMPDPI